MHCYRVVRAPQVANVAKTPARNMAVCAPAYPRFPNAEFSPLFRLFDDVLAAGRSEFPASIRAFQPRFDVKEVQDAYELRGELPGVEQKDIDIEFTDEKTLIIKGRTERETQSGTPPTSEATQTTQTTQTIDDDAASTSSSSYVKATVEDANEDGNAASSAGPTPAETTATVEDIPAQQEPAKPKSRYWVSERSSGEFQRTFNFPSRIDQEAVKASLKNGILSIIVPKVAAPGPKRVAIE